LFLIELIMICCDHVIAVKTLTMNVGVAHSDPNPNSTYFNSKGMWVTYILVVAFIHYMFLSLPFLSVAMAWTLTNVLHNMVCQL